MNVTQKPVLVCNRLWQAIGITTVEDALTDIFKDSKRPFQIEYLQNELGEYIFDKASFIQPISVEEWMNLPIRSFDTIISSIKMSMRVPLVIICSNYSHMPIKTKKLTLGNIYDRDNGICQYSGKKLSKRESSIDHIIPKSRGGRHDWKNVTLADRCLNSKKGNQLNEEAGLKLLKQPKTPMPQPICSTLKNTHNIREWDLFLKN